LLLENPTMLKKPMVLKIALLMWFVALALSLLAKANGRS